MEIKRSLHLLQDLHQEFQKQSLLLHLVKVRLQAREHMGCYTGPIDCCYKLYSQEGVKAFFIGLQPTLWRNCIWNTVYFGLMERIRRNLPTASSKMEASMQTFGSGFVGACCQISFSMSVASG